MMEEGFYRNKPADYAWLILFSASVLLLCSVKLFVGKEMKKF
jgi:Derlin-2/3